MIASRNDGAQRLPGGACRSGPVQFDEVRNNQGLILAGRLCLHGAGVDRRNPSAIAAMTQANQERRYQGQAVISSLGWQDSGDGPHTVRRFVRLEKKRLVEPAYPDLDPSERLQREGLRAVANTLDREVPVDGTRCCIIIRCHLRRTGWAAI